MGLGIGKLAILSLPLLLFPRFLLFLSVPDDGFDNRLTPLERFLSAQFGMFLVTIAITLVLYIPDTSVPIELRRRRDSLGHPLLGPLTGTSLIAAFVSYNTKTVGSLAFLFFLFTAIIGSWGMWVALFEGSSHVSRKTGADKRTSAFLFGNKTAASKQKKEWKRAQSGGAIR
ncbi:hypothetical protein BD410DRAFT_59676 [Rickenella mellea]|uniref:Uncharacterized protein n=1 Tax=Rickenella mellea TaxID=50990 RepID=A0A4Y7QAY1_9AGAM|nr:hypothetical protein BD410DRAFT_59676 [Rickenella mellea]